MDAKAIVIDCGSESIRIGLSGEETPNYVFPSVIGYSKGSNSYAPGECFVGERALEYERRALLNLNYPIERGVITNWEDMEKIIQYAYDSKIKVEPNEHPALISVSITNPKANVEKMAQVMFESLNVPSFYMEWSPYLSLISSGRTTGAVLDIGDGVSEIYLAYEEILIGEKCLKLAGRDITYVTNKMLEGYFQGYIPSLARKAVEDIKKKHSYVALDYEEELAKAKSTTELSVPCERMDGSIMVINEERFQAPEIFFNPTMSDKLLETVGIHEALFDSINSCDKEVQKELYRNIVLCGGSSMIKGLKDRLEREIWNLAPGGMNIKIFAGEEGQNGAWIGGSILSSLYHFPNLSVIREDYLDEGVDVIHRKFFKRR